jgi:hypothetical protein
MQEQVHHIFIDGIAYCLYETCMKKKYLRFYDPSLQKVKKRF